MCSFSQLVQHTPTVSLQSFTLLPSTMKRSYTFEERQNVLGALEAAKEAPSLSKSPQSELIRIAAGKRHPPSRSTIYHWLQEQLTEEEYK